ncbi:MAG: cytochrome C552 [Pedosphaera sp.]|nr:cytochrome C552 [Pedosphaera sp.]
MKRIYFAMILSVALAGFAAPVKIELPAETGAFKLAPGAELANGQCLSCHSIEYVSTQPLLPRAFWASSVKKMQEKYGAPVPADQVDALVNYLTLNYGTNGPGATPSTTTNAALATASSGNGPSVATKYGCLNCHNVSVKIVGPAYKDIADKYRNDAGAKAKIEDQVHKGGSGKWGPVIMPPFPQVTTEETKVLTDWILAQK